MAQKYDAAQFRANIPLVPSLTGLSVPGTAASATDLLRIPLAVGTKLNTLKMRMSTGGTAAGPTITVNSSLAGTGALVPIGTYAFGTNANGAVATLSFTSTEFANGDEVVISNVAGTVAATPVIVFSLGYVD